MSTASPVISISGSFNSHAETQSVESSPLFPFLQVEQRDETMRNWAELPIDLLLLILQKLVFGKDYYRFACVCKFWTSVCAVYLKRYAPPCLIVPAPGTTSISNNSKSRLLLGSPVGKDIDKEQDFLPQVRLPFEDVYVGSHQGWLVMLNDEMTIYLLNPFSGTRIHLPDICEYQLNDIDMECLFAPLDVSYRWPRLNFCKSKVVLSTIPTASNCFVLVIYGYKKLAFCKVADEDWTYIGDFASMGDHPLSNSKFFFMDAIYFQGQFLVVSASGEIFGFDPTVYKPTLTKIYGNGFHTNHPVLSHDPQPHWYLVECRGQLLRILQVQERLVGEGYHENRANSYRILCISEFSTDPIDEFYCRISYCSYWFEVCKLDTRSGSTPSWISVDNFEGDAFFLGRNQSFSLSNPHEFGYKENRIYFTDHRSVNNDMGVYDLDDCTVEPLYKTNSKLLPSAIWVIPKP